MSDYLIHYGIKGQKKGIRNFQYEDGSLTPEGRIRYGYNSESTRKKKGATTPNGKYGRQLSTNSVKKDLKLASQSEWHGKFKNLLSKYDKVPIKNLNTVQKDFLIGAIMWNLIKNSIL